MTDSPLSNAGQAGADIEVTMEMAAAGGRAYREWSADTKQQAKLNAVANLSSCVYRAMERERRLSLL